MICALPFLMLVPPLPGQMLTADDIMCRVAENQAKAQAARNSYVYDMNVFVRLKRANGKLAREESREYVVAPAPKGAHRKLLKLEGRILEGKTEISYNTPRFERKNIDVDAALTDSFARQLLWRQWEMGPMIDWFPLTGANQPQYAFRLDGQERYRDYDVYKVSFHKTGEENCWTGEALIERDEFQPVLITTSWGCKVPLAVTLMLGTTVSHVGAKVTYQRLAKDVWFPATAGGEMKLRVLFLYARTIAFSAKNSGFRKTDVQTSIQYEDEIAQ